MRIRFFITFRTDPFTAIIVLLYHSQTMAKKQTSESELPGFPARVPDLKPGTYKDGTPLHEVQFLECKIILRPDRFTSAKSFREYGKLVEHAAEENGVECTDKAAAPRPEIREVLFLDTAGFSLYNNAFILRRRIQYFPRVKRRDHSSLLPITLPISLNAKNGIRATNTIAPTDDINVE